MPSHQQQFSGKLLPVLAIFFGLLGGQPVLADSEKPPATQVAAGASPPSAAAQLSGPQVYNAVCIACHAPPGLGGAPALGNAEAWAARLDRGLDTLVHHALNGFSGSTGIMPRKGGRLDLSDEEIIGAVKYMVEQVER